MTHLSFYETSPDPLLLVSTSSHVVAALNADLGTITWRHVFETDPAVGAIRQMAVTGSHLATVSGSDPLFMRLWDPASGALVLEHLVRPGRVPDLVSLQKGRLYLVNLAGSDVEIISYEFDAKKMTESNRQIVLAPFPASNIANSFKVGDLTILNFSVLNSPT